MIFYFSCTGNTEWAAKVIGEAIGEDVRAIPDMFDDQETVLEPDAFDITLRPGETIGFCFPVHGWRPPLPVRAFARQCSITDSEGHYCWMLCTAGDDIGETVDIMQRDLETAHLHADSTFSVIMPNTYVGLPFMDVDKEELATHKISQAEEKLKTCIEHIKNHDKGVNLLDTSHWPRVNSRLLGRLFITYCLTDKPFEVDHQKCRRCGLCTEKCPVDNIEMDQERYPFWKHTGHCITCFACYHHCPHNAIQWGKGTQGKGKYYKK